MIWYWGIIIGFLCVVVWEILKSKPCNLQGWRISVEKIDKEDKQK